MTAVALAPGRVQRRRRRPVLIALLLLAACGGCSSSGSSSSERGSAPGAGGSSSGETVAPASGRLVFTRGGPAAGDRQQIVVARPDGSDAHQLVHSDADDTAPVLSPDGATVVFTRRVPSRPDRLFTVGVDGSGLRQLQPSGCPGSCGDAVEGAAWSPDGHLLAFTRTVFRGRSLVPARTEIWLTDVRTGSAHAVTSGPATVGGDGPGSQDGGAGWSPDGRRLVFTHWDHGAVGALDQFAVMTMNLDGTDRQQVSPNDVNAGQPAWSPDGTLIAFQSPPDDEGVRKNLYTIRPDGTGMTSLTEHVGGGHSARPAWSPDGSLIVFSHVPPGVGTAADLYVVRRDSSLPRPIARTPTDEEAPYWGPAPRSTG